MSAGGGGSEQDFDLNLAPIIDCFTVLITYLLVSASFISLSVLNVGVAASGTAAPAPPPGAPPLSLTLRLGASRSLKLKLSGGPRRIEKESELPARGGAFATDELVARIADILSTNDGLADVSVSADPTVQYKDVVRIVETLRKTVPKVYLSKG